jgi:hypothetical protein
MMITPTDRVRGLRQSRPPPIAIWLFPAVSASLAFARIAQVRELARRFSVGYEEIIVLLRLTESERIGRPFAGYEVAIREHMFSVGVLLGCAAQLVVFILLWRSNSRMQARIWKHLQKLEEQPSFKSSNSSEKP